MVQMALGESHKKTPFPSWIPMIQIPILSHDIKSRLQKKHSIYPAILDYNIMVYQDLDLKIFEYPTKYHK